MRIGLLTGGGDCAGLNAAIRATVRAGSSYGDEFVGFHHGWRGVVEDESSTLTTADTKGILQSGARYFAPLASTPTSMKVASPRS